MIVVIIALEYAQKDFVKGHETDPIEHNQEVSERLDDETHVDFRFLKGYVKVNQEDEDQDDV